MEQFTTNIVLDGNIKLKVFDSGEEYSNNDLTPHSSHCLKKNNAKSEVGAFKELISDIKNVNSFIDLFAGTGWTASLVIKYLKPKKVVLVDYSSDCAITLQKNFGLFADINQEDSFEYINRARANYDFICAGFNGFTLRRLVEIEKWEKMFLWMGKHSKKFIYINDSALYGSRFKEVINYYQKNFKMKNNFYDYYRCLNDYVYKKYGFGIIKVIKHRNMRHAAILFQKNVNEYCDEVINKTEKMIKFKLI